VAVSISCISAPVIAVFPSPNVRHFCDGSGHDPVIARNHGDADGAGRGIP